MKNILKPCDKGITRLDQISISHPPCPSCGSTERKLGAGKGPHTASLRCGGCDCFIKWIGKSELAKIENQGGLR